MTGRTAEDRPPAAQGTQVQAAADVVEPRPTSKPPGRRLSSPRAWAAPIGAAMVFLAAGLSLCWNLRLDPAGSAWRGGYADVGLFVWFIDWSRDAVFDLHTPFLSEALNAPYGVNALSNTSIILPGLLLSPVTAVAGPILTFNLLVLAGPVLSAWTMYLVLGRVTSSWVARMAGGLVFGFTPPIVMGSTGHLHLSLAFFVPLVLAALVDCLRGSGPPWRNGLRLAAWSLAQLFTGAEVLALTAVTGAVLTVVTLLVTPLAVTRARAGAAAQALLVAAAAFLAVAAYPVILMFRGPQAYSGHIFGENAFSNDPLSIVTPSPYMLLSRQDFPSFMARFGENLTEVTAYLGWPLVVVVLATGVLLWKSAWVRITSITALVVTVFSFGARLRSDGRLPDVLLPWAAGSRLPLLENLLPNRFSLLVAALVAVLLAIAVDRLMGRGRRMRIVGAVVVIGCLAPLISRPIEPAGPVPIPSFFTSDQVEVVPDGSVALVLPMSGDGRSEAMIWQAAAQMRFDMVGGYFIGPTRPRSWGDPTQPPVFGGPPSRLTTLVMDVARTGVVPQLSALDRASLASDVDQLGIRTVIVGTDVHTEALVALTTAMLQRGPALVEGGVHLWSDVTPADVVG